MTKMEYSNVVSNEISPMIRCMGSLSGLSENELETLIKEATKEIACRKNRQRKEDISNAIEAIQKLSKHCLCLKVNRQLAQKRKRKFVQVAGRAVLPRERREILL